MAPYLDTVKVSVFSLTFHPDKPHSTQSFADVPITDAGVDTLAFLEAAQGLVGLFGMHPMERFLLRPRHRKYV